MGASLFMFTKQERDERSMTVSAEAKGSKSPVKELEEKVAKVLGRKLKKGDLVWKYQAQPCGLLVICSRERIHHMDQ